MNAAAYSNFVELFRRRSAIQNSQTAFIFLENGEDEAGRLTYGELDLQAQAIAATLQERVQPGDRALLLYPAGLDFISAFFGCLYAGVIAVPAYAPRQNRAINRILAIAEDASASVVLTTDSVRSNLSQRSKIPTELAAIGEWIMTDAIDRASAPDWREIRIDSDTLAFLQYTSGSTGRPKGVMVTHENLIANNEMVRVSFRHSEETVFASWLPLFHDMGLIGSVLQPLYLGILSVLMAPAAFIQKPVRWLQAISRYRATTAGGPNSAYEVCVQKVRGEDKESLDLSSWNVAFNGAEPIRAGTLERFAAAFKPCGFRLEAIYPCYGLAEATIFVAGGNPVEPPTVAEVDTSALEQNLIKSPDNSGYSRRLVGCGGTSLDQKIVIVDPVTHLPRTDGQVGEIWVCGRNVARGYWNQPEETERTFCARLANSDQARFLRTGDLGFVNNGELFVTGRLKDLIIIRGRNYYPQDIEATVESSHPALESNASAAFSVEVGGEERLVVACEVRRGSLSKLNSQEVITAIRRAIAEEHEVELHAALLLKTMTIPKTSSGKIQRRACKDAFLTESGLNVVGQWRRVIHSSARAEGMRVRPPRSFTDIQDWLLNSVASCVGVASNEINPREPFTSYGLDSQKAVLLSGELQDWLGSPQPPTLVYDFPTIEILARHLAGGAHPATAIAPPPVDSTEDHRVAIIGMGCRFPRANSPEQFWRLLCDGVDAIREVPPSRWDARKWAGAGWGGFIDGVDLFDPEFFGISPREAETIDPQQRLLLEVAWEALENAGRAPDRMAGTRTGVFIGISSQDYSWLMLGRPHTADPYFGTSNAFSIAANRLSYHFDLRGPSMAVDTACSSSLVAIHQACRSLRHGECDLAISGGVNLMLTPELTVTFSQAGMMSPAGRCKTFDADADGYVRGEGCGVVILKRLSDAVRDGDNILAIIRGSAVNQDGRTNGLTAPNGPAQQDVIREALRDASAQPRDVSYVEAHGTGTPLGDPIELNSLKNVLCQGRSSDETLWVGSVKTNIGHLEAAAGIASLIKVVLALRNKEIPPHLNMKSLNPFIALEGAPIQIPASLQRWPGDGQRIAGVSSFGFGGTNTHIILEEAEPRPAINAVIDRPLHLLSISARTDAALRQLAQSFAGYLQGASCPISDVAFTSGAGRSHFAHRLAVVASSSDSALHSIESFLAGGSDRKVLHGETKTQDNPVTAFLFTGQGSQYTGMARELFDTQPTFRRSLELCDELLRPFLKMPLLEVIYPQAGASSPLNNTEYTQPALFAVEYALAEMWKSWGISPSFVMGHSVGEYVAACVAGVFSPEDGLMLIRERARLMQSLTNAGGMASVFAEEEKVKPLVQRYADELSIAAINGPKQTVISGSLDTLKKVTAELKSVGMDCQELTVSHGFHSPLMRPILSEFSQVARSVKYEKAKVGIISNVTGEVSFDEVVSADYWCRHILAPVDFVGGMNCLDRLGCEALIEIGPKPTLLSMGKRCIPEGAKLWLPSLQANRPNWATLLESLASLYVRGAAVDWSGFDRDYERRRVHLPTYPFQRRRCWIEADRAVPEKAHPLLGRRLPELANLSGTHVWEAELNHHSHPYLRGHQVLGSPVLAYSIYVEMALASAREAFGGRFSQIAELELHHPVFVREGETVTLQLVLSKEFDRGLVFRAYNRATRFDADNHKWTLCASAKVQPDGAYL